MPPYIKYCLNTFNRSGVNVIVLNPANINNYLTNNLNTNWRKLKVISQKVDCLRVSVLYKNGGMWADADSIFIKNCKHLFDLKDDFFACEWTSDKKLTNGYFIGLPNNPFLEKVLNHINSKLNNDFKPYYNEDKGVYFGETTFGIVRKKITPTIIPLSTFLPVEFRGHNNIWREKTLIENYIKSNTVCIGLNHSQFGTDITTKSIEQLCAEQNLIGSIFRYSKKLEKN